MRQSNEKEKETAADEELLLLMYNWFGFKI